MPFMQKVVSLDESIGRIAGESIMIYPPGIPIISLGEVITNELVSYIRFIREKDVSFSSSYDEALESIKVVTTKICKAYALVLNNILNNEEHKNYVIRSVFFFR